MNQKALVLSLALIASLGNAFAQPILNTSPSRVVGQPALNFRSGNPNVVEGREFFSPWSVAVDTSSTPNALYVADFGNNRVLAWRDARTFSNGALADAVIGQLDRVSTTALGPGTSRQTGLSGPGGMAVDAKGSLYVVDTGNNRILRFPKPFEQPDEVKIPNMVIGQPSFATETANINGISEKTLFLVSSGAASRTGLAFDRQGNLWVTDRFNHRVLRYPAAALDSGANQPSADLVLGQPNFTTNTAPTGNVSQTTRYAKDNLRLPLGLAVDSEGRVFVADEYARVLVYTPPYVNGKAATRLLGVGTPVQGQPLVAANEYNVIAPQSVFLLGDRPGVVDAGYHRILIWDPYTAWAAESEQLVAPPARVVIGQADFASVRANRQGAEPNETTLSSPFGATAANNELYVADSGNHRVLVFPQVATNASATRVLGQLNFNYNAPNLTVGSELNVFQGLGEGPNIIQNISDGGGIAIDTRSNPPRLYISDTYNHRILGYRDARRVRPGDRADIVIGQNDFNRVLVNAPQNVSTVRNDSGLFKPSGLAVDSNGDLFVADSGNARVLRFGSPFQQAPPAGERYRANLVLGQADYAAAFVDPSPRTMAYPFGLAFTVEGHLLVSDAAHSRILFFRRPAGGDFSRGQAAEKVFGQPDFFTAGSSPAANRLSSPRHITIDTDDRMYVADSGKDRVAVYDRVTAAGIDPSPAFTLPVGDAPQGVYVSPATGELWVAIRGRSQASRYKRFEFLGTDQAAVQTIPSASPLALAQDANGALYIAEAINRVAIYFNGLTHQTAGNYAEREISRGGIATLYPRPGGRQFSAVTQSFNELPNPLPLPTELADTQVLFNDQPARLYFVSPGQINFLVPMNAPESGVAEIQVVRPSTGEIVSASSVPLGRVSPALFAQSDQGQIAALNQDQTVNSSTNPAKVGSIVAIFGTGQGFVPNAPPDGVLPTGQTTTESRPRVFINTDYVPDQDITYSGLAPGLVGVWQINFRIPEKVPTTNAAEVVVELRSVFSNRGSGGRLLRTTIAVAQ